MKALSIVASVVGAIVLGLLSNPTQAAATPCVSTASDLQTALTNAQSNGQDDVIRIVQKSGQESYLDNFTYDTSESDESYNLTLEGGYTDDTCTSRVVDPTNTVLDGGGVERVLNLFTEESADFVIEGLTLRNGDAGSEDGGGLYAETDGDVTLRHNAFTDNSAYGFGVEGGGARVVAKGNITLAHNNFRENTADPTQGGSGGGALVAGRNLVTLDSNSFHNNTAWNGGGAWVDGRDVSLKGNVFGLNQTVDDGAGAVVSGDDEVTLENNTFIANKSTGMTATPGRGGGAVVPDSTAATVSGNTFRRNSSGHGGGAYVHADTVDLDSNTFSENAAIKYGGGTYVDGDEVILLTNIFRNNTAGSDGGGVLAKATYGTLSLVNNTLSGNTADNGGGVFVFRDAESILTNNTLSGNTATDGDGGGVFASQIVTAEIYNNIVWGNTSPLGFGGDLYLDNEIGALTLSRNDFDWAKAELTGAPPPPPIDPSNLNVDPNLVCAAHLHPDSPVINMGDNTAPDLPDFDIDGDPRILDGTIDIGADEIRPEDRPCPTDPVSLSGMLSGFHQHCSTQRITLESGVEVSNGAKVYLVAPEVGFEPGVEVHTGAELCMTP